MIKTRSADAKLSQPGKATAQPAYDAVGRPLKERDSLGNDTTYHYDPLGRLDTIRYPDGATTSADYDAAGNLLTAKNALGGTTTFTHDPLGRLQSVTGPDEIMTLVTAYDGSDNPTQLAVGGTVNPTTARRRRPGALTP